MILTLNMVEKVTCAVLYSNVFYGYNSDRLTAIIFSYSHVQKASRYIFFLATSKFSCMSWFKRSNFFLFIFRRVLFVQSCATIPRHGQAWSWQMVLCYLALQFCGNSLVSNYLLDSVWVAGCKSIWIIRYIYTWKCHENP
jgi:hypothetical protein